MSSFTGNLVVRIRTNNPKPFEVFEMFEFHVGRENSGFLIRCLKDFVFDGTSMPKYLQWLISPSDPNLLQCAAIHDQGFQDGFMIRIVRGQEYREIVSKYQINLVMAEAMEVRKVKIWKQVVINTGLRLGSSGTWERYRNGVKR